MHALLKLCPLLYTIDHSTDNCSSVFLFCRCDTMDKLRKKSESLEREIRDQSKFKDFYQFTFSFAKNPGQKGLGNLVVVKHISLFHFLYLTDLEMAIAYWNIVLKGKFKFLDL